MALACFSDQDFEELLSLMRDATSGWEVCNEGEVKVERRPDKKNKVNE